VTTDELIEQVKTFDPQERAKVLGVLLELEAAEKIVDMEDQSFDQAAKRVLERHADLLRKLAQ
jgi:hypothetical protein